MGVIQRVKPWRMRKKKVDYYVPIESPKPTFILSIKGTKQQQKKQQQSKNEKRGYNRKMNVKYEIHNIFRIKRMKF